MASRDIDAQIRQRIEAFLQDIGNLVRQSAVTAVQEALTRGSSTGGPGRRPATPAPTPSNGRTGKRTGKKRGRRAGGAVRGGSASADQILSYLRSNPDSRMEQISAALGVESARLRPTINELIGAGQVRKAGERRGTSYAVN